MNLINNFTLNNTDDNTDNIDVNTDNIEDNTEDITDNIDDNTENNMDDNDNDITEETHDNQSENYNKIPIDIDIKDVITRINKLNTKEKMHILNILRMTKIDYTKNVNGYFFNLLQIDTVILEKICNCLDLIEKNSGILKEMDRRRIELLSYYKNLIEERLQKNIQKKRDEYVNRLQLKDPSLNIVIKRKIIKKKRVFEHITDPDLLIKEYIKYKNRFQKGSVYHRITVSIKLIRSNKSREMKSSENDELHVPDENDSGYDNVKDNESVVDITEDSFHISDNEEEIEEEKENDKQEEDEDDDEKEQENDDGTYISEEDIENVYDDEIEEEDKITSEDNTENEFRRFKNLLYKQGFEFDDNKNCLLIYQDYII
jgi:hypothetical protein